MSKKRCPYCGKVITTDIKYCNDTCKNNYDKFEKNVGNNAKIFGVSTALSLIISFIGALFTVYNQKIGSFIAYLGVAVFFIVLMIFPFATPTTIELFGVKKSKIIVRTVILILVVSIIIPIIAL
ncbi:MAG: DUF2116 family Zn-ribbon domain-containing protein [Sarcina sp.]